MQLAATQSQLVAPGATAISTIAEASWHIATTLTWRLISDLNGAIVIAESSDGIVEVDDGRHAPNLRYDRPFTAPDTSGRYIAIWRAYGYQGAYGAHEIAETIVVAGSSAATFASTGDVASRLGRTFATGDTSRATLLLNMASALIADAAGYDDGWAVTLNPVPQLLRGMAIELAARNFDNPGSYNDIKQQVGSYSISLTRDSPGMNLTDAEVLAIRRAVHGRTTASARVDAGFVEAQDEYWLRQRAGRFRRDRRAAREWGWDE